MAKPLRFLVRWFVSIVLVSLPTSYLFWQWRFNEQKVLKGYSYDSFNEMISKQEDPALWTYAIYTVAVITALVTLVGIVASIAGRLFPGETRIKAS
ncbi:MAG: hypothetical protein ACYTGR_03135 [Planctomycetota bacterium]|jgi:hypothetical protein